MKKLDSGAPPSGNERERLRRGRSLLREGRYEEARAEFEAVLAAQPKSASACLGMGLVLLRQDRAEEALTRFIEARTLDPLLQKAYVLEGQALVQLGRFEPAMTAFRGALNLDPKSVKAMTGLGQALLRQGRHEEALTQLREALRYDPRKILPRQLIAEIFRERGQPEAAIEELRLALEVDPGHVRSAILLARLLVAAGARGEAEQMLGGVLARLPEDSPVRFQLGRAALDLKFYPLAEGALRQALDRDPDRTAIRLCLVEALLGNGKLEDAELQVRELPQNSQIGPMVHKLLGDIHYRRKQFRLAVEEYRATVLNLPDHQQLLADLERELDAGDRNDWEEMAEMLQSPVASRVTEETERVRQNRQQRRGQR